MLNKTLIELFTRDLQRLIAEIDAYEDEAFLWKTQGNISNSAGNLCLHLIGNLKHFIGATLGNTGYIRQRDDEFNLKNISRRELKDGINQCAQIISVVLSNLSAADLEKEFPIEIAGIKASTTQILLHLYGHLNYHLGQVNYHRRMLN